MKTFHTVITLSQTAQNESAEHAAAAAENFIEQGGFRKWCQCAVAVSDEDGNLLIGGNAGEIVASLPEAPQPDDVVEPAPSSEPDSSVSVSDPITLNTVAEEQAEKIAAVPETAAQIDQTTITETPAQDAAAGGGSAD